MGKTGQLPSGWELKAPYPFLTPSFKIGSKDGRRVLVADGRGNADCLGWVTTPFRVEAGQTYRLSVEFRLTRNLNPNSNLLFSLYVGNKFNDGVFKFKRLPDSWIEGTGEFLIPGSGMVDADVRVYLRYCTTGRAWIGRISLQRCDAIAPRPVRLAATQGTGDLGKWGKVLDAAAKSGADLVLLPETFNGVTPEALDGPSGTLMARKAAEHGMYVSGTFQFRDEHPDRVYNLAALYDRKGQMIGRYYKNHPYSPEAFDGVTPGTDVPVFRTDFGTVGMIICYDSWFTDVTELLALKGAEVILFPNAGYYRSLMPARTADNCVRIVASSQETKYGIWDTSGADVTDPDADVSRHANCPGTFVDVTEQSVEEIRLLTATLDFSLSPSPHNWGGPMLSAPGGRRNRREQKRLLVDDIKREICRWCDD